MLTQRTYIQRSFITALVLFLTSALCAYVQKPAKELERFYKQELTFGLCEGYATTDDAPCTL
jgi:branched-subunit amino acid permease